MSELTFPRFRHRSPPHLPFILLLSVHLFPFFFNHYLLSLLSILIDFPFMNARFNKSLNYAVSPSLCCALQSMHAESSSCLITVFVLHFLHSLTPYTTDPPISNTQSNVISIYAFLAIFGREISCRYRRDVNENESCARGMVLLV